MNGFTLLLIAVALAMDACAVSMSAGATLKRDIGYYAVRAALFFGIFQGGMPIIGYLIGEAGSEVIAPYDHWIAFILLSVIGGKMCYESLRGGESEREAGIVPLPTLLLLSIAISIDALAVGVTFALLETPIVTAALVIGVVTFFASLAGVWAGRRFGCYLGEKVEVIGGVILIGIGVKILVEGVFV